MQKNIVVVNGRRTPFGAYGGSLKDVSATDLSVHASKATLEAAKFGAEKIDHVVFGNVVQASADAIYLPRHVGLKTGVPENVGALGLNRLCGSGFQAWITAAQMILTGEANHVLAGGAEQMSQVPYVVRGARWGYRMGPGEFEDYLTAALIDQYSGTPMAITAENLAEKYQISRAECDAYSILSQERCSRATKEGIFNREIIAYEVKTKKGVQKIERDEHPKPDSTLEKISQLKAVFKKDGVVTAASASGIVDGAAASLIMTEDAAKAHGLKPLSRIKAWASVGCDPKIMGIGPAYAIRKLLDQTQMKMDQIDLFEVNEAFAAQYLAVEKELKLPRDRTNLNGGAIAIGPPLGASGTRIMNHLALELERKQLKHAIGSACIGGGQGIAILIERI